MNIEIFEKVKEIVIDLLDADEAEITMDARFRHDLHADSLDLVELVMEFEERFGSEISDEVAQTIESVGDAVRYIEAHM